MPHTALQISQIGFDVVDVTSYVSTSETVLGKKGQSNRRAHWRAYQRDVWNAEVFVLDAGHFALDTDADTIAAKIDSFLAR